MKVLELFAGTRSIGKAFENRGHQVYSVEWNREFEKIDLYADISKLTAYQIIQNFGRPDVIWASPDCSTFSVAGISHHRRRDTATGNLIPISTYAKFCDECDKHVVELIKELNPKYYFIENPYAEQTYLKANFVKVPDVIDMNRSLRGDYMRKPTAYWFWNCEPTHGFTKQEYKGGLKKIMDLRGSGQAGLCSEDRSMISPDYARNWICDFVLGKTQQIGQLQLEFN